MRGSLEGLRKQALILPRGEGWIVVDARGEEYLRLSHESELYTGPEPYYWSTRKAGRENLQRWLGHKPKKGRKRTGTRPEHKDRRVKFERLMACLHYAWKKYPSAVTLESVQAFVEKRLGIHHCQRPYRRDMYTLVEWGYCVKNGPTYTAVPEFRRWWSDEFEDGPTPRSL